MLSKQFSFALLFIGFSIGQAQNLRNITLDKSDNGSYIIDILNEVEKTQSVDFISTSPMIESLTVNGISSKISLKEYLELSLGSIGLGLYSPERGIYFILSKELQLKYGLHSGNYIILNKERNKAFQGILLDSETKEPLIGAQISLKNNDYEKFLVSDLNGSVELSLPVTETYEVSIQYVGYKSSRFVLAFSHLSSEDKWDIKMFPETTELRTVTVTAEGSDANVNAKVAGKEVLNIESIKKLPTFLGDVDPLKSLSTLPGISSAGDLASGVNVRGGTTGQNLIIQDQAVIYNPTHLFGLFSGFNPDMVSRVEVFKGSGPAKYGGRVSSVMDVKLRNGDTKQFLVNGGIGIISSRIGVEGPISRNKSSFIFSGRIAYPNKFLSATKSKDIARSNASFHDFTGRVFFRLGNKDALSFSQYYSNDEFQLVGDSAYNWMSVNTSMVWSHTFNEEMFSSFSLTRSKYDSELNYDVLINGYTYSNGVTSYQGIYEFIWEPNYMSEIIAGIDFNYSILNPGNLIPNSENTNVIPTTLEEQKATVLSPYVQASLEPSTRFGIVGGIRMSTMRRNGPGTVYFYDYSSTSGNERYPLVTDSVSYLGGESVVNFSGLEPRISLRYLLGAQSSFKASYYRGYQYIHQISNTASASPQDFWIASGPNLKPQISDQLSLGYFYNSKKSDFEFSGEVYYKKVENAIDYIEGVDVALNKYLEGSLIQGKGFSYGLEFQIKKTGGLNTGWISYTYSRSLREFNSVNSKETINNGEYYSSNYDQPHNLSIVYERSVGERGSLSANFKYITGRPITIPEAKFPYMGYLSRLSYSDRNEYRLPDYHRLDVSFTLKDRNRLNKAYEGEWIFSIYNIYGRKNAYSIFFNQYGSARKLSILGSIVPSITYNFKF